MIEALQSYLKQSQGEEAKKIIHFPEGLPAFEDIHDFVLINNKEEEPFLWLQSVNLPELAFITIDPFLICPNYSPDIADEDLGSLEIQQQEDVFVLSIVNMKHYQEQVITANLVGLIVINWKKKLGKQVIIQNHQDYAVKHAIT